MLHLSDPHLEQTPNVYFTVCVYIFLFLSLSVCREAVGSMVHQTFLSWNHKGLCDFSWKSYVENTVEPRQYIDWYPSVVFSISQQWELTIMKHWLDAFSHLKFTRLLIDLQFSSLLTVRSLCRECRGGVWFQARFASKLCNPHSILTGAVEIILPFKNFLVKTFLLRMDQRAKCRLC